MEIQVRRAQMGDAEQIAQFQIAMAWESEALELNPDTVLAGVRQLVQNELLGSYYLAFSPAEPEVILGCMMVTKEWSDWNNTDYWWLQSVYVREEYRRKGIFTQMVEWLENQARQNGVNALRLYVDATNTPAQACYEKLGLHKSHYLICEKEITKG